MNGRELMSEIVLNGLTMSKLANIIGISRTALYRKIKGVSEFSQSEISLISNTLKLNSDKMISIFFSPKVS